MKYLFSLFLVFLLLFSCHEPEGRQKEETIQAKPAVSDTTACLFSEIAYCPDPEAHLDKWLPGWKVVWNPSAVSGNHAFVATDGHSYVIAFRGSLISFTEDAFSNWIYNDLNVAVQDKWPYSNIEKARISQGSYTGWQNLEKMKDKISGQTLREFVSENVKDQNPLVLTGHSLGGNLATVYASYLWWKFNEAKQPKNNINVITFAAPAAGNRAFAEDFDTKFPASLRIENRNDIVPKFPCSGQISKLGKLYSPETSAENIEVGYKNITTKLSNVFDKISLLLELQELRSDFSGYMHTNGDGKLISIPLSGKNKSPDATSWFSEAGYQHSMAQYASSMGTPVIVCE